VRLEGTAMFALPFTPSSLPAPLGQGLLARFLKRPSPLAARGLATAAAPVNMEIEVREEDFPDLAQRVREVGEW
jgi:hypothetical protein